VPSRIHVLFPNPFPTQETDGLNRLGRFLAAFAGVDNPTSNDRTRELLGWEPTHPGWVQDVETGQYFA